MQPEFTPAAWWEVFVVLAAGSSAIIGAGALAARLLPSPLARRSLWQAVALGILVLAVCEFSGIRSGLVRWSQRMLARPSLAHPSETTLATATGTTVDGAGGEWSIIRPARHGFTSRFSPKTWIGSFPSRPESRRESPREDLGRIPNRARGDAPLPVQPPTEPETAAHAISAVDPPEPIVSAEQAGAAMRAIPGTLGIGESGSGELSQLSSDEDGTAASPSARVTAWWPAALWGLGACAVLARMLAGRMAISRFRRRCAELRNASLHARVRQLARELGLRRPVRLLATNRLHSPIVFGGLRPAIILPAAFDEDFDPGQQEAMLAHELSHLASADPAWHGLATLVCAVLWWQPLAWWSRRKLREASEAAADEASLLVPDGARLLAASLLLLARRLIAARPVGGLAVEGGFRSGLGRRVERLLQISSQSWRAPRGKRAALARFVLPMALALAGISSTAWAPAQAPYPEGGTTMSVFSCSWRSSLAAATLFALLGPSSVDATAQDKPAEKEKPAIAERERAEREHAEREHAEREKPAMKPDGERERPRGEAREDQRRDADARVRQIIEKRRELEEAIHATRARLQEMKEGSDDRKELEARMEKLVHQLREMPVPERPRPDQPNRERIMHRLEQIREQVRELRQAGKEDAIERLQREARELMQALGQGDRPRGEVPEAVAARVRRLRVAAENLREAGFMREAEHVAGIAEQLQSGREVPMPRPEGREGPPREIGPGAVQELRGEVQQMRREMQELREQLKRALDRADK